MTGSCDHGAHAHAGVSREAKKHIKTSTASKGDLQLFIQLALGKSFDPALLPELAVPKALSLLLKEEVTKVQADQWLRRSNSGAPYFVSPELEEKLQAADAVGCCLTVKTLGGAAGSNCYKGACVNVLREESSCRATYSCIYL